MLIAVGSSKYDWTEFWLQDVIGVGITLLFVAGFMWLLHDVLVVRRRERK